MPPYCGWPGAGEVLDGFVAGAERVDVETNKTQTNMNPRIENNFFILYLLVVYLYMNMSSSGEFSRYTLLPFM
jgi:hypothetical protein